MCGQCAEQPVQELRLGVCRIEIAKQLDADHGGWDHGSCCGRLLELVNGRRNLPEGSQILNVERHCIAHRSGRCLEAAEDSLEPVHDRPQTPFLGTPQSLHDLVVRIHVASNRVPQALSPPP